MPEPLAQFDALLRAGRPAFYARLRPGASDEALASAEAALGAPLPPAFRAFYRWRDVQGPGFYTPWLENLTVLPLRAGVQASQTLTGLLQAGAFDLANWWHPRWLPSLDDGAGNHLCLDLAGSFTGRPGQIIEFWHDDAARPVVAPDFATWLGAYVRLLAEALAEAGGDDGALELYWQSDLPGYPLRFAAGAPA